MNDYWNYVDVLAYALALNISEEGERFSGDSAKWHRAVYNVKKKYYDLLPEAFGSIFFDVRLGYPLYSSEVDHFFHVLIQSRLISMFIHYNSFYEVNTEQKNAIIRLNKKRLRGHKPLLIEIGRELVSQVKEER